MIGFTLTFCLRYPSQPHLKLAGSTPLLCSLESCAVAREILKFYSFERSMSSHLLSELPDSASYCSLTMTIASNWWGRTIESHHVKTTPLEWIWSCFVNFSLVEMNMLSLLSSCCSYCLDFDSAVIALSASSCLIGQELPCLLSAACEPSQAPKLLLTEHISLMRMPLKGPHYST